MKFPSVRAELCALPLLGFGCAVLPVCGSAAGDLASAASYAGLSGDVLLDNARVLVQKFVVQPGQSTGRRTHPADQLIVFIKGGVLKSQATGRSTLWRDGRVVWQSATDPADEGSTNTGQAPIEMDVVTLKPVAQPAAAKPKSEYLNYPNIPGEDVLENEQVIVQRFTVKPGQWEGVHAHGPDMLYIHIKGGQWAEKTYREAEHPYPSASPDGEAGWMPTIDIGVGHQSGNIGKTTIDLVWITLKK
jgi:hypothetical protein